MSSIRQWTIINGYTGEPLIKPIGTTDKAYHAKFIGEGVTMYLFGSRKAARASLVKLAGGVAGAPGDRTTPQLTLKEVIVATL